MPLFPVGLRLVDAVNRRLVRSVGAENVRFRATVNNIFLSVLMLVYVSISFVLASAAFGFYFWHTGITGVMLAAIGSLGSILWPYVHIQGGTTFSFLAKIALFVGVSLGSSIPLLLGFSFRSISFAILGIPLGIRCHLTALKLALRQFDFFRYICLSLLIHLLLLWLIKSSTALFADSSYWIFQLYGALVSLVLYVTACVQVLVGNVPNRGAYDDGDITYFIIDLAILSYTVRDPLDAYN